MARREETQTCLCPAEWAGVLCPGTPGQASPFNPEEPGNFRTLPLGIHSLPFPLPNYTVGGAGIQPGPQIPALGGAQGIQAPSRAPNTPFGTGFHGDSPGPLFQEVFSDEEKRSQGA